MVLVRPSPSLLAVIGSRLQCFDCSSSTAASPPQHCPILPNASSLYRTAAPFTPSVQAEPELNVHALSESVRARGLSTQFPNTLLNKLLDESKELQSYKDKLKSLEAERLANHLALRNASGVGNAQEMERRKSLAKALKTERARYKELSRDLRLQLLTCLLQLPNKLRPELVEPIGSEYAIEASTDVDSASLTRLHYQEFSDLVANRHGFQFTLGKRARWEYREMLRLWHRLSKELAAALSPTAPIRSCLLSDFARLPAVEASAWLPPDEVIHMEATADDVFVPDDGSRPLINPFTRLCLVGSSSLASFAGSLLGCRLEKPLNQPLRFLALGNLYRKVDADGDVETPSGDTSPFQQTRQISFFEVNHHEDASAATFTQLTHTLGMFWSSVQPCWSIRLRRSCAKELRSCEMARSSLLLRTSSKGQEDVELASISLLGDWVSRRIGFTTNSGSYPSMVFANSVNLNAIMEAFRATDVYVCPSDPTYC
uniref:Uncharacterized protein n=1 Tax=Schistocephalus solidus TaxID=70667 RepID=A0A0X3PQ58_SCHSO